MQYTTACLHFRCIQRRCVWAVGRLGVAAWLACVTAAVDWQARQSCLVWCGGVNCPPDKCVLRRSASGGRTAPPDTLRYRPDSERTCLHVCRADSTHTATPDTTRQSSLCRVWRKLAFTHAAWSVRVTVSVLEYDPNIVLWCTGQVPSVL